ncbi:YvrJ family protein [Alkalibacterium olivapovliticus]|uniref:YvrJ-like protein n=1 Tax=Alkalibacterium olivapovliticus TaxID=99907 RepID=A0A2T0WAD2_9LACT|nr:YvrJ family protein [Alkalibacterium olivapovliticus]PRY83663.1 YvrJ-like protein [Alkalibacterium olivapovliticus]
MPETSLFPAVIDMIANVGFPIFISLVLLHRMETKLDAVVKALNELTTVTARRQQ